MATKDIQSEVNLSRWSIMIHQQSKICSNYSVETVETAFKLLIDGIVMSKLIIVNVLLM